jgi:hypothetical protein
MNAPQGVPGPQLSSSVQQDLFMQSLQDGTSDQDTPHFAGPVPEPPEPAFVLPPVPAFPRPPVPVVPAPPAPLSTGLSLTPPVSWHVTDFPVESFCVQSLVYEVPEIVTVHDTSGDVNLFPAIVPVSVSPCPVVIVALHPV